MSKKILIVEDEFIVANDLSMMLESAGYDVCGIAGSVIEARELIIINKPQLILLDIYLKGNLTGIDLAKELRDQDIAFVFLSANSSQKVLEEAKTTQPYGFLVKPFREKDVLVGLEIARYVHEQYLKTKHSDELLLQNSLTDILNENIGLDQKLLKVAKIIQPHIPFDYVSVDIGATKGFAGESLGFLRTSFNNYQIIGKEELQTITGSNKNEFSRAFDIVDACREPAFYNGIDFDVARRQNAAMNLIARAFKMESSLVIPLTTDNRQYAIFSFFSRNSEVYNKKHLALFPRLQRSFAATKAALLSDSVSTQPSPKIEIKEEFPKRKKETNCFDGIIGSSHLLLTALDHLSLVAPQETSVLILGESGTGKERFARCVHSLSARNKKQIVVVNCAALPHHLIESELFGHEKGAFTGANDRRIGKFEQASGGTIFLDEIGELPLESQAKLLRALQEKEIERLGGKEILKVDVRVIAATNCNLEKEVANGKFRLDLYYRLNVFPIKLPALRERKEDIPLLVDHFLKRFADMTGKLPLKISDRALEELRSYDWPGNVRELEHLIERNVLLSRNNLIERIILPSHPSQETMPDNSLQRVKSIDENEKDYILSVLKKCNGRVSGPGGAAELLEVPPTTLNSKMKRLGITRKHVSD